MPSTHKNVTFTFRLTSTLRQDVEEAAERAGLSTADWARGVLARAANEGAFAPPKRRKRHGKKRKG
jgi:predicted HicB family RNase H-like nuclease